MTFAELFTTLESRGLIPKRAPAKQSSLRHLAKALGYPTLESAPVGEACRDPARWTAAMKTYFATQREQGRTMTAHNCDNILTDLRWLLKLADAQGLLTAPLPVPLLTTSTRRRAFERQKRGTSPYQDTYGPQGAVSPSTSAVARRYPARVAGLHRHLRSTPPCEHAGDVRVPPRNLFRVSWPISRATPRRGTISFAWTFCANLCAGMANGSGVTTPVPTGSRRCGQLPPSPTCWNWISRGVTPLVAYARGLKPPAPLRDKQRYHWATLPEIEAVANSLLAEGRLPFVTRPEPRPCWGAARRPLSTRPHPETLSARSTQAAQYSGTALSQASLAGCGDWRVDPALYGEGTQGGHAQGAGQCV